MTFELQVQKRLQNQLRQLVRNQIEGAIEEIDVRSEAALDHAIHEIRKRLKRIRAVLRLVRGDIGKQNFRAENQRFRDIARPFTEARDARVLLDTLNELQKLSGPESIADPFYQMRTKLADQLQAIHQRVIVEAHAFSTARTRLIEADQHVKKWLSVPNRWSVLGDGLQRTYKQSRKAFRKAKSSPEPIPRHEWRKLIKYLGYQIELFRPVWTDELSTIWQNLDQMGKLLGEDHDLAVLRATITKWQQAATPTQEIELLTPSIDQRQSDLQQQATSIGERFFAASPKIFVQSLKSSWKKQTV